MYDYWTLSASRGFMLRDGFNLPTESAVRLSDTNSVCGAYGIRDTAKHLDQIANSVVHRLLGMRKTDDEWAWMIKT